MNETINARIFELAREVYCELRRAEARGSVLSPLKAQTMIELETEIINSKAQPRKPCVGCPGCGIAPLKVVRLVVDNPPKEKG